MYLPASFREDDLAAQHALIAAHPLGTLVASGADGFDATPLPFQLVREAAPFGLLRAHLARANPLLQVLAERPACLVVFGGPQGYVSPSWYPSKAIDGRVVPTWNYAAVHVHGEARVIDDTGWLRGQIEALTSAQEAGRPAPWSVDDAPADFVAAQLRAIVGVEIAITRIEGKWKMSQNREAADRDGVIAGLRDPADPQADPALAALIAARAPRP